MTGYRCIVADPPWLELGGGGRGAQNHYTVLQTPEIARVMLRSPLWRPARDAHFWCWTTDNFLLDALGLIDRLGFRYLRTFAWVKSNADVINEDAELQIGLGQYARGAHELCLLSTRGSPMVPAPADRPSSVIIAPRGEHSRKPAACYGDWFESVSPGPRLEMFARAPRQGWDVWGNEIAKFTEERAACRGAE